MAVDEAGNGAKAPAVDLDELAFWLLEVAHRAKRNDTSLLAEDVGIVDYLDVAHGLTAQRCLPARMRGNLSEIADEQAGRVAAGPARRRHQPPYGGIGCSRPW